MKKTKNRRRLPNKKITEKMEKVAQALDISKDFLAGTVKVTVVGTGELVVEGTLAVVEYTDTILRLNTSGFILSIFGADFEVTELDTDFLSLSGKIESVSYMT